MGKLEDAATWLVFYVIRPAVQKVIDKLNESYRIFIEIAYLRIHVFLHWIATSNISIFTWVKNEIADAIEEIEDNDGGWFGWIWDIVDSVLDAIEDIFVKVSKLSNKVLTIIADWWKTTRDLFLSTLKDTFVSVADFIVDVQEAIADWWTGTWKDVTTWANNAFRAAADWIDSTYKSITDWWKDAWDDASKAVNGWIKDATNFVTKTFTDFIDWINELPGTIADFIKLQVDNIISYINEEIPKVVGSMFEWAKPVIDPIIAAAGWLESLTDVFTAKAEDDPDLKADIDTIQAKRNEINIVIGRLP